MILTTRNITVLAVALVMLAGAVPLLADGHEFSITVHHGINGRSLGLDKDLAVVAEVSKDGGPPTGIPLSFKDTVGPLILEQGTYMIKVKLDGTSTYIDSMELGPVFIEGGSDVFIRAKLSGKKTPVLKAVID